MRSAPEYLPEWLREIPAKWPTPLLRLVTRVESGHTPSRSRPEYWVPEECVVPWFTLGDIWQLREGRRKYLGETEERVSQQGLAHSSARILPKGTVVLSRTASVGFAGIMPEPMATTQDFANFVCGPKLLPEFLLWVLRGMRPEFDRLSRGSTHQTIYMSDVMQFRTPTPGLDVQNEIANFLDRKTAAIDALITKKERLIELLEEERAGLIHRAVTRGLDPEGPMKDSGVPWIGEIPAHWAIRPIKHLLSPGRPVTYGIVLPGPHVPDGIPIVKANNCRPDRLRLEVMKRTAPEIERGYRRSRLRSGDVVIAIRGSVGSVARVPAELEGANLTQDAARLSPGARLDAGWLTLLGESAWFRGYLEPRVAGATVKGINIWDLARVPIPDVPIQEQRDLVATLGKRLSALDDLAARCRSSVTSLSEYRQALITAAVTGQVDIPEVAA